MNSSTPPMYLIPRYHSTSAAPKTNDRKCVIYDWLKLQHEAGRLAELKPETDYRKFELVQFWTRLKNLPDGSSGPERRT